jgi:hypothetical protein
MRRRRKKKEKEEEEVCHFNSMDEPLRPYAKHSDAGTEKQIPHKHHLSHRCGI